MRLLPRDCHYGWTPYVWLAYLGLFLLVPATEAAGVRQWAASIAATAVFLVLYFTGYWVKGGRLLLVIAAIFAIGAVFAPSNPNASVFFVYAASFAGKVPPARRGAQLIGVVLALVMAESLVLHLSYFFWIPALVFSVMIGGVALHHSEQRRAADLLAASQAEVQQLVRIAERERIARDLHDLLGHTLSLIALKAELAGKLIALAPERAAAEIRDVESVTRNALREVRAAIGGYRSEGLPAELARARLALEAAGVRSEYLLVPLVLPAATEAALALAVREAVTNVVRHARAAVCSITLERRDAQVLLEVADDGRGGVGGASGAATGGIGLQVMRERLAGLGGRVEIADLGAVGEVGAGAGAAGVAVGASGTRLRVTVPYVEPPAPPGGGGREGAAVAGAGAPVGVGAAHLAVERGG